MQERQQQQCGTSTLFTMLSSAWLTAWLYSLALVSTPMQELPGLELGAALREKKELAAKVAELTPQSEALQLELAELKAAVSADYRQLRRWWCQWRHPPVFALFSILAPVSTLLILD